jgi:Fe-S cluster assembly protein SufD
VTRAEESLVRQLERPATGEPAFAAARRRAGGDAFRRLLLPTLRHEEWRYTSLAPLAGLDLAAAPPGPADRALVERLGGLPPAPRLVLVNGRLDPTLTDLSGLPAGARAGSLAAALRDDPALLEAHLGRHAPFGDQAFAALSDALFSDGALLVLPDGAAPAAPVHVVHLTQAAAGPVAVFPRVLVLLGKGAKATVCETWAGEGPAYLAAAASEVALGEGAELELVRIQREAPGAFHVGLLGVEQAAGSRFTGRSVALGGRLARVEARAVLAGERAENHLDGLSVSRGQQVHDHFVHVDHAVPRGLSRELFKGILDGSARAVFCGRVLVRPDAQKADAAQVSSNLLLSEDATVDTRPQLEILADDVKCSHGGTVGQLDETALFYLRSRGLDPATARALLTWAFAAEMVERISAPAIREPVRRLVTAHLPDGERLREAA